MKVQIKNSKSLFSRLKSPYDNISTVDYFFYQWDPSTTTTKEQVCGTQGGLCWNKPHLVTFHESILVSL